MTVAIVTGCAGFVGSHLAEACLDRGQRVVGIDVLTDYYDIGQKRSNLARLVGRSGFEFHERDVLDGFDEFVQGVDVVYHQAGQPGVRDSWREQFDLYLARNVAATQRVLEACTRGGVRRIVFASSSSVYGNADQYPVREDVRPQPFSPYGVTKLAAEHLCTLYGMNDRLSVVSLRYFTVYGPRQRPDMAAHRLFEAALNGTPFPLFGGGEQVRDFTFVNDVVRANLAAADADVEPGAVFNIAGGGECSMHEHIALVEEITGRSIKIDDRPSERGDVRRTGGSTEAAAKWLEWTPEVDLRNGLEAQYEWHMGRRK